MFKWVALLNIKNVQNMLKEKKGSYIRNNKAKKAEYISIKKNEQILYWKKKLQNIFKDRCKRQLR